MSCVEARFRPILWDSVQRSHDAMERPAWGYRDRRGGRPSPDCSTVLQSNAHNMPKRGVQVKCRRCKSAVTTSDARYDMPSKRASSSRSWRAADGTQWRSQTFVNPMGHRFELLLFHTTWGTRRDMTGYSTASFFPGYRWHQLWCRCGSDLGWTFRRKQAWLRSFLGAETRAEQFHGLIRARVAL